MTTTKLASLLLAAFLLLAAACGQKSGVAGSITGGGSGGGGAGSDDGFDDLGGDGTGDGDTGDTATGGGTGTAGGAGGGTGTGTGTGGGAGGGTGGGTASGPADRTGISNDVIKIGMHAPITGAAAIETFSDGAGVYSEWRGKTKALGNREVELETRDDEFDPSTAQTACRDLIEREKVFVLLGAAGADQIQACARTASQRGVPYISPGVTQGVFDQLAGYFAVSETYNQQNVQLWQLVTKQIKKKKMGVILTDSPLLDETRDHILATAPKAGIEVLQPIHRIRKDANKGETDTKAQALRDQGAEVVYALISPTPLGFLASGMTEQAYFPTIIGPGLSNGINLVATALCAQNQSDVQYLHPSVQMDVVDQYDVNYQPAYRERNGASSRPDDIGLLLWGIEKTVGLMLEAAGPDMSRQSFIQTIKSGKTFESNVFAPVKFGAMPHFGATQVVHLKAQCAPPRYNTQNPSNAFVSGF